MKIRQHHEAVIISKRKVPTLPAIVPTAFTIYKNTPNKPLLYPCCRKRPMSRSRLPLRELWLVDLGHQNRPYRRRSPIVW